MFVLLSSGYTFALTLLAQILDLLIDSQSFDFLSEDTILSYTARSLDIYTFSTAAHSLQLAVSYALPPTHAGRVRILSVEAQSPRSVVSCATRSGRQPLYQDDPAEAVVAMRFQAAPASSEDVLFVTHVKTLLSRIPATEQGLEQATRFIPWDEWGPSQVRLIERPVGAQYTVCGTRVVASSRNRNHTDGSFPLEVYDFNQHRMRMHALRVQNPVSVGEGDEFVARNVFDEVVIQDRLRLFMGPITAAFTLPSKDG